MLQKYEQSVVNSQPCAVIVVLTDETNNPGESIVKKIRLIGALCVLASSWCMSTIANAAIIYNVDRIIDAGTVTGSIETDGALGVLAEANITGWTLTLTAPNLDGGSPDVIFLGSVLGSHLISGAGLTATTTQLLFDFGLAGQHFLLISGNDTTQNFWCLETANASCTGNGIGEHMGWPAGEVGGAQAAAQSVVHTGNIVIAEVQSVPVPAAIWLFGSGLLGLVGMARQKKAA